MILPPFLFCKKLFADVGAGGRGERRDVDGREMSRINGEETVARTVESHVGIWKAFYNDLVEFL